MSLAEDTSGSNITLEKQTKLIYLLSFPICFKYCFFYDFFSLGQCGKMNVSQ